MSERFESGDRRARVEEADAAFCLVREYFAMAGVVMREDREEFIEEYFGMEQGFGWRGRTMNWRDVWDYEDCRRPKNWNLKA